MKKNLSTILIIIAIICFMGLAIASGSNDPPTRETGNTGGNQATNNNDTPPPSNDNTPPPSNDDSNDNNDDINQVVDERFGVGDTATFSNLKITAEEIIINDTWENDDWSFFEPDEGNKFFAVKFTVENISDEHQNISSILLFDAYSDGVKLEYSFGAAHGLDGTLDGEVAPNRKMVGYYGVEVSENAKELELEVRPTWLANSKSRAMFAFNLTALG